MKLSLLTYIAFFWLLIAADCIFILLDLEPFRLITKGLLLPVLYFLVLNQTAEPGIKDQNLSFHWYYCFPG